MNYPNFKLTSSEMIHEGFLNLQIDTLKRADNLSIFYHVILAGSDAVSVLAKDSSGNYVINFEYRHPTKKMILSTSGGRIEEKEEVFKAAKRELLEETGYCSDKLYLIGSSYPFPSVCNQKIHFVFAKDVKKIQEPQREPFEYITTKLFSREALFEKVFSSDEVDSTLCSALFYLENWTKNESTKKLQS